jgi:hypothetical protein
MLSIASRDKGAQPEKNADATPAGASASAAAADAENRKSTRRPAASMPQITGLRIKPHGVEAMLVDISETGLLAECSERLKPGSAVTAVFEGTIVPNSAEGRVVRSTVWSVGRDGRLRYHVGIGFTNPFPLEGTPEAAAGSTAAAAPAAEAPAVAQDSVAAPATTPAAAPAPTPPAPAVPHTPAFAGRTPGQMPVIARKPSDSVPLAPAPAAPRVVPVPAAAIAAAPRVVRNRW